MKEISYHEIVSLDDPYLKPWLDLYQTSFPLVEQMLMSEVLSSLRSKSSLEPSGEQFLVALNDEYSVIAMSMYDKGETDCGALWYLAVNSDLRSQGIGAAVFSEVKRRIFDEPGKLAFVMEVEDPAMAVGDHKQFAERRIEFYRRQAARILGGINYIQNVGWQPPVPMKVMVSAKDSLLPQDAFSIAKQILGDGLSQTGELTLS